MQMRSLVRDTLYKYCPRATFALHSWWYWLRAVEPEIRLVPQLCVPGTWSLDIGAHYGIYSYFMRRHSEGVISFEPNQALASRLRIVLRSNSNVREIALSDVAGTANLHIPRHQNESCTALASIEPGNFQLLRVPHDAVPVPTGRLDDFLSSLPRVGFIKIDVEGHELRVLQGARGLLERDRPNLLVETEERHCAGAVANVWALLRSLGYDGYFQLGRRLIPIEQFKLDRHQCLDAKANLPYINNFIFLAAAEAHRGFSRDSISPRTRIIAKNGLHTPQEP